MESVLFAAANNPPNNSYQLISTHIIHSHSYEPFIHSFIHSLTNNPNHRPASTKSMCLFLTRSLPPALNAQSTHFVAKRVTSKQGARSQSAGVTRMPRGELFIYCHHSELEITKPYRHIFAPACFDFRSKDFAVALEIAEETGRPVVFIHYGGNQLLPSLPFSTLLLRNIQRFAKTGRYIPVIAIDITEGRCKHLLDGIGEGQEAQRRLCEREGFLMRENGTVMKKSLMKKKGRR